MESQGRSSIDQVTKIANCQNLFIQRPKWWNDQIARPLDLCVPRYCAFPLHDTRIRYGCGDPDTVAPSKLTYLSDAAVRCSAVVSPSRLSNRLVKQLVKQKPLVILLVRQLVRQLAKELVKELAKKLVKQLEEQLGRVKQLVIKELNSL